jgi:hypothetical protein
LTANYTIIDVLEVLKYLAGLDGLVSNRGRIVTPQKQPAFDTARFFLNGASAATERPLCGTFRNRPVLGEDQRPTIIHVLEQLKRLAKIKNHFFETPRHNCAQCEGCGQWSGQFPGCDCQVPHTCTPCNTCNNPCTVCTPCGCGGPQPCNHTFGPATCTQPQRCTRTNCNAEQGAPLGHMPNYAGAGTPAANLSDPSNCTHCVRPGCTLSSGIPMTAFGGLMQHTSCANAAPDDKCEFHKIPCPHGNTTPADCLTGAMCSDCGSAAGQGPLGHQPHGQNCTHCTRANCPTPPPPGTPLGPPMSDVAFGGIPRSCPEMVPCTYHATPHTCIPCTFPGCASACGVVLSPNPCPNNTCDHTPPCAHPNSSPATCITAHTCLNSACGAVISPPLGRNTTGPEARCGVPKVCANPNCDCPEGPVINPALEHQPRWDAAGMGGIIGDPTNCTHCVRPNCPDQMAHVNSTNPALVGPLPRHTASCSGNEAPGACDFHATGQDCPHSSTTPANCTTPEMCTDCGEPTGVPATGHAPNWRMAGTPNPASTTPDNCGHCTNANCPTRPPVVPPIGPAGNPAAVGWLVPSQVCPGGSSLNSCDYHFVEDPPTIPTDEPDCVATGHLRAHPVGAHAGQPGGPVSGFTNCTHCIRPDCPARTSPIPPAREVQGWLSRDNTTCAPFNEPPDSACDFCKATPPPTDDGRIRPLGRDNRSHYPTIPYITGGGRFGQQNPPINRVCANPLPCSSGTSQVPVCHSCGYCRPCEWRYFGVIHCTSCQWGTDCLAALRGRRGEDNETPEPMTDTTGRRTIRWCSENGICAACCTHCGANEANGSNTSPAFAHADVTERPDVLCDYDDGRPSVCRADCNHHAVNSCARCAWRGYGVIVCRGCSRTTDCISASGAGTTWSTSWNYTANRCNSCA